VGRDLRNLIKLLEAGRFCLPPKRKPVRCWFSGPP